MSNETIVLLSTDALDTNLQKENVTDAVLSDLKQKCSGLSISGIDDTVGYKKVDEARKEVKRVRILAEKICDQFVGEAHAIHKQRTAKRKEILSRFEEIETPLNAMQKSIDDEKERIRKEEEEKFSMKIQDRINQLLAFGKPVEFATAYGWTDDQFSSELLSAKSAHEETMRIKVETERKQRDESERLEKQRQEQEAERLKLESMHREAEEREAKAKREQEAAERKLREEREAIEREKQRIEDEKKRVAELEEQKKIVAEKAAADERERIMREQREKEEREAKEKAEAERLEKLKPIKDRVNKWVESFSLPVFDWNEIDPITAGIAEDIHTKFDAFVEWAKKKAQEIK